MAEGAGGGDGGSSFETYRSILTSLISEEDVIGIDGQPDELDYRHETSPSSALPPWRRQVGSAFFLLDSHFSEVYGETIPPDEEDEYERIVSLAFRNFSDVKPGSDQELIDWTVLTALETLQEGSWGADKDLKYGQVAGDDLPAYNKADNETPGRGKRKRACFNCGDTDHEARNCPQPRDQVRFNAMRDAFESAREAVPDSAMMAYDSYARTEEESSRRVTLSHRFTPGKISQSLTDAVFPFDPSADLDNDDNKAMLLSKVTKRWPWITHMIRWGYPPGWIATLDPMEEARRRIRTEPLDDLHRRLTDDEEDSLLIFGEDETNGDEVSSDRGRDRSPVNHSVNLDHGVPPLPPSPVTIPSGRSAASSLARFPSFDTVERTSAPLVHDSARCLERRNRTPSSDDEFLEEGEIRPQKMSRVSSWRPPTPISVISRALPAKGHFDPSPPSPPTATDNFPPPPPPPPDDPAPPPPVHPPRPWWAHSPPSPDARTSYRPRRWATYDTDTFNSDRLTVYTDARPLPLGHQETAWSTPSRRGPRGRSDLKGVMGYAGVNLH